MEIIDRNLVIHVNNEVDHLVAEHMLLIYVRVHSYSP